MVDGGRRRPAPEDWNPKEPWSCAFKMVVKDSTYWLERVRHPATAWIAGSPGAPKVASEAEVLSHLPGTVGNFEAEVEERPNKRKLANKEKRLAAKRGRDQPKVEKEVEASPRIRLATHFVFCWASGSGPCAECACAAKRARKCRKCLSFTSR